MTEQVLLVGCGYVGQRVARLAREQGSSLAALGREPEGLGNLEKEGIQTVRGDLDDPGPIPDLPTRNRVVFYFVPPPGGGDRDTRIRNFLGSIEPGEEPAKIIYIGTSGVYGDCRGEMVTEETPVKAQTPRARRRLDAETILTAWSENRKVLSIRLRVTGIYGPDRLPLDKIRQGLPVLREEDAPLTNRIHADDLARTCLAAAKNGRGGEVFNLSDGHPTTMTHYFNAVADAFGLSRPPQVSLEEARKVMTPLMLSYFSESRRMDNRRMLEKLAIKLQFPDLEMGIKSIGEAMHRQGQNPQPCA